MTASGGYHSKLDSVLVTNDNSSMSQIIGGDAPEQVKQMGVQYR